MSQFEFQECFDCYDEALALYTWPEVDLVTVISPQPVQHVPSNCPLVKGNQTRVYSERKPFGARLGALPKMFFPVIWTTL